MDAQNDAILAAMETKLLRVNAPPPLSDADRLLVKEYEANFYHSLAAPVLLAANFKPLIDKPHAAVARLLDELFRLRRVCDCASSLLTAYDVRLSKHGVSHNTHVQSDGDFWGDLLCAVAAVREVKP